MNICLSFFDCASRRALIAPSSAQYCAKAEQSTKGRKHSKTAIRAKYLESCDVIHVTFCSHCACSRFSFAEAGCHGGVTTAFASELMHVFARYCAEQPFPRCLSLFLQGLIEPGRVNS